METHKNESFVSYEAVVEETSGSWSRGEGFLHKLTQHLMLCLVLLVTVGLLRIFLTYSVFWQTWDEPVHIAAGMEWLDRGQYTRYDLFHPPLASVMNALGLYLSGIRTVGNVNIWDEGNAILHANGAYEHNLTLARLGTLPFFLIASFAVALWAYMYGGALAALLSVTLFTTLPTVLAHSGFATLDMACAALVTVALLTFCLWLDRPTLLRSHLLGISVGSAILAKLSSLGFLVASGGLIGVIYGFRLIRSEGRFGSRRWIAAAIVAVVACFLVIWAGYRFSFGLLSTTKEQHEFIDRIIGGSGPLRDTAYFVVENVPVPAPEFFQGVGVFLLRYKRGFQYVYFLGDVGNQGWWYFFPVLLLVKTPLPFLLLTVIGFFVVLRNVVTKQADIRLLAPAISIIGVLAIGILGTVNNGVRQVLAIYPLLAIVAGYGASRLLHLRHHYIGLALVTVLLSWQIGSSFAAHPDYYAYFNELAEHPEEIVADDIDWGQDLKRLATTIRKREINQLAIRYNGSHRIDLDRFNLPPRRELVPYQKTTGWIAVSLWYLKMQEPGYSWLKEYQPVEQIGKSIRLYYIPGE